MKHRVSSVCSPRLNAAARPGASAAASHWGNRADFSYTQILLWGNRLRYHWGGGQTVQQLQEKTLSLQSFSPPTHSASTTTRKTLEVGLFTMWPCFGDMHRHQKHVGNINKTRSETVPDTGRSIRENTGASVKLLKRLSPTT